MAKIVPAVLAETPEEYARDLEIATSVSRRIQIDLADGVFAPNRTINLVQAHWPDEVSADIHLMFDNPTEHTEQLISMSPNLVIIHFEARDSINRLKSDMLQELSLLGIKTGVALLPKTTPQEAAMYIERVDHVLVFTGELGHYGGKLDKQSLDKIAKVKKINNLVEVGVDGGINNSNAAEVVAAGADILNVGGYIQKAPDPQKAYATLLAAIQNS